MATDKEQTWAEAYSNPKNLEPSHTYQWAKWKAKRCWHCETLALMKDGYRLVFRRGMFLICKYDKFGRLVESYEPTEAETTDTTWRLWTDNGNLIRRTNEIQN